MGDDEGDFAEGQEEDHEKAHAHQGDFAEGQEEHHEGSKHGDFAEGEEDNA